MKWRTDKPTAETIVVKYRDENVYNILHRVGGEYCLLTVLGAKEIPLDSIEKWADLEEDETVTDCHQLGEEIESEWAKCKPIDEGMGLESANIVNEQFDDIARHFAKWGAEHLIAANKMIGDHIADDGKKVSDSNNLEEAVEGEIMKSYSGALVAKTIHCIDEGKFKFGDKVKIIILKDE